MKILLTSMSIEDNSRFPYFSNTSYPLGLAYLYSILEKNGHEVRLEFLNNYSHEYSEKKILDIMNNWKPDITGFQIFSMTRVSSFKMIERVHNDFPKIKIIIGGVHATIMYEQILLKYPWIIAVLGEAEQTIIELISALKTNENFESIKGIAYNEKGIVKKTGDRELIQELDLLPLPKHDVFFDNDPERTTAHMITSRGCPFDCSFCCLKLISKQRLRKRGIENVVEEIVLLKKKYPRLTHIQFHDDTLLIDNKRVIEFCKLLIKENLNITFECSARVKPISYEMFYWLEKAGCKKIMFGLETGSQKLWESTHKKIKKSDLTDLFKLLKKFKFTVTTFLMCGFPGENNETVKETVETVRQIQRIKYSWIAGVGKLWIYPGTEVYEIMKQSGKIDDDYWMTEKDVPFNTTEYSLEELIKFENEIMDNVSLERIFTIKGFYKHFLKMPFTIIRFLLQNPGHLGRLKHNSDTFFGWTFKAIEIFKKIIYLPFRVFRKIFKIITKRK